MIRKGTFLFILVFFSRTNVSAQHLSHQVIVPAAGVKVSNDLNYSQTIGETAVEMISAYDYILTQGFQQPRLKFLPGIPPQGSGVEIYPNPVIDILDVELFGESPRTFSISVINIYGSVVHQEEIRFNNKYWHIQEIPVSGLSRGLYIVRVVSRDGIINRSFKLEKM